MNTIGTFYKLLNNSTNILNDNLIISEKLFNTKILLTDENSNYIELKNNNRIEIDKIAFNTLKLKKTLYQNTQSKYDINEMIFGAIESGYLKSCEFEVEETKYLGKPQTKIKPIFFTDKDKITSFKTSFNLSDNTNNGKLTEYYSYKEDENNIIILKTTYLKNLNMENTDYNDNKIKYSNGNRYQFGFSFEDVIEENNEQTIYKNTLTHLNEKFKVLYEKTQYNDIEYSLKYTLFYTDSDFYKENSNDQLLEGNIKQNILLFGDGNNNSLEYWETDLEGIRFINNGTTINISANEIIERTQEVTNVNS